MEVHLHTCRCYCCFSNLPMLHGLLSAGFGLAGFGSRI